MPLLKSCVNEAGFLECPECGEDRLFFYEPGGHYCDVCGYNELKAAFFWTRLFFPASRGDDEPCVASVTKFIPGDHYHVELPGGERKKFNDRAAANLWINERGYIPGVLEEKFFYTNEGD